MLGLVLEVVLPTAVEMPGPWFLDPCSGSAAVRWESKRINGIGFAAYVDLIHSRIMRLVPLRLDGALPVRQDLKDFGGVVHFNDQAVALSDFLDEPGGTCDATG